MDDCSFQLLDNAKRFAGNDECELSQSSGIRNICYPSVLGKLMAYSIG